MPRTGPLALVATISLALAGCLDYSEQLVLQPDGSGTLSISFVADMSYMDRVSAVLGDQPDPEEQISPTREEVLAGLEVEGITVEELEIEEKERKSRVRARLRFESLEALTRIEGFGDDRRIEFYDEGDGKVRLVYSFETQDVIPVEELGEAEGEEPVDAEERQILQILREARESLRFRARIELPGAVLRSNGKPDPRTPNAAVWRIDREQDPERHAVLGHGRLRMQLLVDRASVPFVRELRPLPAEAGGEGEGGGSGAPGAPGRRGGLGD